MKTRPCDQLRKSANASCGEAAPISLFGSTIVGIFGSNIIDDA